MTVLLIGSALLFVKGTLTERAESRFMNEHRMVNPGESHETTEQRATEDHAGSSTERMFGINPESDVAIAAGAGISLLFALAIWLSKKKWVLGLLVLMGLTFAALDLREVIHQFPMPIIDLFPRPSLVVIASLLTLMHLAISGIAAAALRRPRVTATTEA